MSAFNPGANCFLGSPLKVQTIGPNPSTERGKTVHINAHPKESRIIYTSGKLVVVRNLDDPNDCFVYRGHSHPTTVAKFSPNGYWVASADTAGKVRVWSWDNPEHLMKIEVPALGGVILDLDWDFESKRIVVSGESGGMMVKAFQWDTGNSMGEMVGHIKRVGSVAYKPTRPFRVMTGGEDFKTIVYAGPPFKLDHSNTAHTNYVNCVRFSPDGSKAVSVGSDKRIQFYDGKTGEPTTDISVGTHAGTISSVSWSPDGTRILTSSADKTCKIWNVEELVCEHTFSFGVSPQVGDMQVAALWTATHMVSLSLNGNLNILDTASPSTPAVLQAHQVAVNTVYVDPATNTCYTGSCDGVVCARSHMLGAPEGAAVTRRCVGEDKRLISGNAHSNKIVGLSVVGSSLVSVGWDDCLRVAALDAADPTCGVYARSVALTGQPSGLATDGDLIAVTTTQEIGLYNMDMKVGALGNLGYGALCVSVRSGGGEVAVGGDDNKTHIYTVVDNSLTATQVIDGRSAVTAVAYSHSGELLAIGDSGRQVDVYCTSDWAAKVRGKWVFHTSKVTCLSWSPSDQFLASGSLDESIYLWDIATPANKTCIQFTHTGGVTGVAWIKSDVDGDMAENSDRHLVSVGNDHTVVTWDRHKKA